jgi:hypothetical protein
MCSHTHKRLIKKFIFHIWLNPFNFMIAITLHLPMDDHHLHYIKIFQKNFGA